MDLRAGDERELWARSLGHDSRAFAAIFDLHRDRVFRHVIRQVESRADADEVTASAFLELWRLRERVRLVDGSVLPWLLVTTSNLARNSLRARLRYRAVLDRLPHPPESEDPATVVAARLGGADGGHGVAAALDRLGRVDGALIALTALEGFATAEAAAALGLSPAAARARLSRARRRLGRDLQHIEDDDAADVSTEGAQR